MIKHKPFYRPQSCKVFNKEGICHDKTQEISHVSFSIRKESAMIKHKPFYRPQSCKVFNKEGICHDKTQAVL